MDNAYSKARDMVPFNIKTLDFEIFFTVSRQKYTTNTQQTETEAMLIAEPYGQYYSFYVRPYQWINQGHIEGVVGGSIDCVFAQNVRLRGPEWDLILPHN